MQSEGQRPLCLALLASCVPGAGFCVTDLCGPVPRAETLGNLFSHHPTCDRNKGVMPRALDTARTEGRRLITKVNFCPIPKAACVPVLVCVLTHVCPCSHTHVLSQSPVQHAPGLMLSRGYICAGNSSTPPTQSSVPAEHP